MFKSKKRGLRSFRNTFILFVIILVIPLIILFVAKTFFAVSPIFPEYQEWVKRAKSDDNGYIFFEGANKIAKRITCGYFSTLFKNYTPDSPETFVFSKNIYKTEKWPPESYLRVYRFLIKENLFEEEIEAYVKHKYPSSSAEPANVREKFCIYPEGNWVEDFQRNSLGILHNLKEANSREFFLPYGNFPYTPYSSLDSNILLIELINVLLSLQKEDYASAFDWIDTLNQFVLNIEPIYFENISPVGQQLSVINIILSYPFLSANFCEDLLCRLLKMKERIQTLEPKKVYLYALFHFENSFIRRQEQLQYYAPHVSIPRSISLFFAYINIARVFDRQREVFETSTWKDIEDAIFYNKGKVFSAINTIKSIKQAPVDTEECWLFLSGEIHRRILLKYNYALCSIYGAILSAILEQYFRQNGMYPNNLEEIMNDYFSEEELLWINDYLDIYVSPKKYYIDYYPVPKREREAQKTDIFKYRKSYRILAY